MKTNILICAAFSILICLSHISLSHAQKNAINNSKYQTANFKQQINDALAEITNEQFPEQNDEEEKAVKERLDQPHRTTAELSNWLSGVIMNALEIRTASAKSDARKSQKYFTQRAYVEYLTFLKEQSYWLFVTKNYYNMNASSTRPPAQLCTQSINNLYTWVFEIPVIINLIPDPSSPNATDKKAQEVVNIKIRLVRVPKNMITEDNPHAVLIESWSLEKDSVILNNEIEGCMN
jgi:Skp family chaperone for outer membrane proteins